MKQRTQWCKNSNAYIYVLYDDERNCYIGQTTQLVKKRYQQHLACAKRYKNNPGKYYEYDLERTSEWIASKADCYVNVVVVDNTFAPLYKIKRLERLWRCIASLNGYNVIDVEDPWDGTYEDIRELAKERQAEWSIK